MYVYFTLYTKYGYFTMSFHKGKKKTKQFEHMNIKLKNARMAWKEKHDAIPKHKHLYIRTCVYIYVYSELFSG